MRKLSRRHIENLKKTKNITALNLEQAISVLQETSTAKFTESVELHANLNINPKYADQQLRTTVILPNGIGKNITIAVLTSEINFQSVIEAEIDLTNILVNEDIIENISKGNIEFDVLIVTPEMMPKLAKLGRILGPKGLMPSPKAGTVTTNLALTINEFKKGKFEYKADRTGIVHVNFGKSNFTAQQLTENLLALYNSIEQNRPPGVKGIYFKSLFICSSMGPSIEIDPTLFIQK